MSRATENYSAPRNVSASWQCAEQRVSDPASQQVTADRSGRRHGLLPRSPARRSVKLCHERDSAQVATANLSGTGQLFVPCQGKWQCAKKRVSELAVRQAPWQ